MAVMNDDKVAPADTWHHVHLAAPVRAKREQLKLMFEYAYISAHKPRNMSLWMAAPGADGGVDVYASPQSDTCVACLTAYYDARPCTGPSRPVVLIAGYQHPARRVQARVLAILGIGSLEHSYSPVPYSCRRVRQLDCASGRRYAWWEMAPFVRRFAEAWSL